MFFSRLLSSRALSLSLSLSLFSLSLSLTATNRSQTLTSTHRRGSGPRLWWGKRGEGGEGKKRGGVRRGAVRFFFISPVDHLRQGRCGRLAIIYKFCFFLSLLRNLGLQVSIFLALYMRMHSPDDSPRTRRARRAKRSANELDILWSREFFLFFPKFP